MIKPRDRVRDETVPHPAVPAWDYGRHSGCTSAAYWRQYGSTSVSTRVGTYTSMHDYVDTEFRKKQRLGGVTFLPMTWQQLRYGTPTGMSPQVRREQTYCTSPNTYKYLYEWRGPIVMALVHGTKGYNDFGGMVLPPRALSSGDVNRVITESATQMLSERGRGQSEMNLAESLAQIEKTLSLYQSIMDSAKKVLLGKRKVLARARAAGSAYLAIRYGLSPVVNDVAGVANGLTDFTGKVRTTTRGFASDSSTRVQTYNGLNFGGAFYVDLDVVTVETVSVRSMSLDEYMATVAGNLSLNLKNLATLPWELLPYSFLVDWFANVGNYLGALVPAVGYHQLGSCYVVERKNVTTYTCGQASAPGGFTITAQSQLGGSVVCGHTTKQRINGTADSGLVWKSNFRFDQVTRIADAAALMAQIVRRP